MERIDFSYEISDERLIAYSELPILDRLRWLDDLRLFTLMVRNAPKVKTGSLTEVIASDTELFPNNDAHSVTP